MIKHLLSINAIIRIFGILAVLALFPGQVSSQAVMLISTGGPAASAHPAPLSSAGWPPAAANIPDQVGANTPDSTPPVIDVWYGSSQAFTLGTAQNWLNILGNVTDRESGVQSLAYTLNGLSSRALSIGPDGRRLARPGDFNIDINLSDSALLPGSNTVAIQAVNWAGESTQSIVQFTYTAGENWALPYTVRWNTVSNIQQAVQVVEGKWLIVPGGVRSVETGYDRVLAVGDITWKDFEILVPVTINAIDTSKYGDPIGVDPGVGVNLHWLGHTDDPVQCGQPKCGWNPTGASVWYEFFANSAQNNFSLQAYPPYDTPSNPIAFLTGETYWIRANVEVNPGGSFYKAKAWTDGSPEPDWMFSKQTDLTNLNHGSLLLVAHHMDVTFGDISITPISTKISQLIRFDPIPDKTYGDDSFTLSASASSGLPVRFHAAGTCAVAGDILSITGAGSCTVTATQAGDNTYAPAADVPVTFSIAKASAYLGLSDLIHVYDGSQKKATVTVNPSGLSGISVTYNGSGIAPTEAGSYAVAAVIFNDNYTAQQVTGVLEIAKANQAITVLNHAPGKVLPGGSFSVAASASAAGLEVTYSSGSPETCTNNGPVFTITGNAGACVVQYDQAGNRNYQPAARVSEAAAIETKIYLPVVNGQ